MLSKNRGTSCEGGEGEPRGSPFFFSPSFFCPPVFTKNIGGGVGGEGEGSDPLYPPRGAGIFGGVFWGLWISCGYLFGVDLLTRSDPAVYLAQVRQVSDPSQKHTETMIIYTGEIQIVRLAIDREITRLRQQNLDLSDPDYHYTVGKIATLYRIWHDLQGIEMAVMEDPDSVEIKVRKSYH